MQEETLSLEGVFSDNSRIKIRFTSDNGQTILILLGLLSFFFIEENNVKFP